MFDLQENLREVSCSVIAVLFTAVFLLSRRRKKRLSLTEPKTDEPKDESELAEEAEAEGGDVLGALDGIEVPTDDVRGTFTIVEKTLAQKKKRRDTTESMITHPEGQDVPSLRIKTSKSPKKGEKVSDAQKIAKILKPGESVIKKGMVVRKRFKGLLYTVRVLCLTDDIRLVWLDPKTFEETRSIALPPEAEPKVELVDEKKFTVKIVDRFQDTRTVNIYSDRAESWVKEISKVIG